MNERNNTRPLFSVIVPAYNSAAFINKCIESVLGQTCSDFELILVDDGSQDSTLDICRSYANIDSRVKVIHKENGGHTSARNEGLRASMGEYILFLDSDDWLDTAVLKICKAEIDSNNPDVLIYNIYNTWTNGYFINNVPYGIYNIKTPNNDIVNTLIMDRDGNSAFVKGLIGKIFRKDVIFINQLTIPTEVRIAEDAAAFIGAVLDSSLVSVVPNATYYYYVREGSVSHSSDEKAFVRLPFLFEYYKQKILNKGNISHQLDRYIVAQLYTATLLVMRSGGEKEKLNAGLAEVLKDPMVSGALKNAKFSIKGYRFLVKKFILRHRLWRLAEWMDK